MTSGLKPPRRIHYGARQFCRRSVFRISIQEHRVRFQRQACDGYRRYRKMESRNFSRFALQERRCRLNGFMHRQVFG